MTEWVSPLTHFSSSFLFSSCFCLKGPNPLSSIHLFPGLLEIYSKSDFLSLFHFSIVSIFFCGPFLQLFSFLEVTVPLSPTARRTPFGSIFWELVLGRVLPFSFGKLAPVLFYLVGRFTHQVFPVVPANHSAPPFGVYREGFFATLFGPPPLSSAFSLLHPTFLFFLLLPLC